MQPEEWAESTKGVLPALALANWSRALGGVQSCRQIRSRTRRDRRRQWVTIGNHGCRGRSCPGARLWRDRRRQWVTIGNHGCRGRSCPGARLWRDRRRQWVTIGNHGCGGRSYPGALLWRDRRRQRVTIGNHGIHALARAWWFGKWQWPAVSDKGFTYIVLAIAAAGH